jgi:hypothetical protein
MSVEDRIGFTGPTTDQRGVARDAAYDVVAFEFVP